MYKEYTLILPVISDTTVPLKGNVVQSDDDTNKIEIHLVDTHNRPFSLESATDIKMKIVDAANSLTTIVKGENLEFTDQESGIVTVYLTSTSVQEEGTAQATLEAYEGDKRITSSRFSFNVIADLGNAATGTAAEKTTIGQLIDEATTAISNANTAAGSVNTAISTATTAAQAANDAAAAANTAAQNATINMPTKTSDLTNDSNYVVDANYTHTDNNYSNADKNRNSIIVATGTGNLYLADDGTYKSVTAPDTDISTVQTGSGNAITAISAAGRTLSVTKGSTFIESSEIATWAKSTEKPSYTGSEISYTNTASGLTAITAQAGIDEVAANLNNLAESTADAYSSSALYKIGDMCIHDNTLYKCNMDMTASETWDATHWDVTTIAQQINVLNGQLNGYKIYKSVEEVMGSTIPDHVAAIARNMQDNSYLACGIYDTSASSIYPATGGILEIKRVNQYRISFLFSYMNNIWHGFYDASGNTWSGWDKLITLAQLNNALAINNLTQVS